MLKFHSKKIFLYLVFPTFFLLILYNFYIFNYLIVDENHNPKLINSDIVKKTHITYVHFFDTTENLTTENFKYFLNFAYIPCEKNLDFTIIINTIRIKRVLKLYNDDGDELDSELDEFLKNLIEDNEIYRKFIECSNSKSNKNSNTLILIDFHDGGDICSYSNHVNNFLLKNKNKYSYFFYINSSARGPFLPSYWNQPW